MKISYFQFAKRLLKGSSVAMPLDPGYEGGTIAAEVLDTSNSLRELCSKCGRNLTCGTATDNSHGQLSTTKDISF